MSDFTASGKILLKGCANPIIVKRFYVYAYDIGSVLYVLKKAHEGVLEKVVIKRVNLVDNVGTVPLFNYVDTTNRIWFEGELTTLEIAKPIALEYLETEMAQLTCT